MSEWPEDVDPAVVDTLFELLSDRYRRWICLYLQSSDRAVVTYDRLLDELSSRAGEPVDRDRLRVRLRHVHLPKLAEIGVVAHDERRHAVRVADPSLLECCVAVQNVVEDCESAER